RCSPTRCASAAPATAAPWRSDPQTNDARAPTRTRRGPADAERPADDVRGRRRARRWIAECPALRSPPASQVAAREHARRPGPLVCASPPAPDGLSPQPWIGAASVLTGSRARIGGVDGLDVYLDPADSPSLGRAAVVLASERTLRSTGR